MKKLFYYTTTALAISCGISQAQTCVPTPTCATLGYTSSTACDGGLKCPFGEAWYCPSGDSQDMTEICSLMGYTQTCTGSNQTGGSGQSCGGLYKECSCKSGYKWDNGACINPCSSPYVWNGSSCVCGSYYKYSCNRANETAGIGTSCDGKYGGCRCASGYSWCATSTGYSCVDDTIEVEGGYSECWWY